jgi:6-phosphofructokinase 1
VLASALSCHHRLYNTSNVQGGHNHYSYCPLESGMTFPEAGPRPMVYSPLESNRNQQKLFRVGIIVSGGTAPGINAVINGIVQRHFKYYDKELAAQKIVFDKVPPNTLPYVLQIFGLHNGFSTLIHKIEPDINAITGFIRENVCHLHDSERRKSHLGDYPNRIEGSKHEITPKEINRPGSILTTGRELSLVEGDDRIALMVNILENLRMLNIKMLYIIGGEGSMRAAHALASISKNNDMGISICGIPKTMDNDILWVWKTFGFHSAVYKASEFINTMTYELKSNPRIGILQLFGSFSGFVVSHAVLGSKSKICDCAIIPEISFSLHALKHHLEQKIGRYKKSLIIIAETAYPHDLEKVKNGFSRVLSKEEIDALDKAIEAYKIGCQKVRNSGMENQENIREGGRMEIQKEFSGKTYKILSNALIKIIAEYLQEKLKTEVITSQPKYLIRDIQPSPIDIIFGNRLAILAVDNMMAGYTDFMISQWLTEFCLIPLKLVVLGTKRIPTNGIFWKSVIAKTGQPEKLD